MTADPTADLRRMVYLLVGTLAVAVCTAKIAGVENVVEPSRYKAPPGGYDAVPNERNWPATRPDPGPAFGSNDRSRWATVRAIVENGTYVVGKRENFRDRDGPFRDSGLIFPDGKLNTLDVVMNPDTGEFYSSKPPLLSTALAGGYWVLRAAFGADFDRDRWPLTIFFLLLVNVLPFAVYLRLLAKLVERFGTTDFGKLFTFAVGTFGTFVVTFSPTLNNHTPAVFCVLFAVYPFLRPGPFTASSAFVSGLCAGFAFAFELPALSFAVGLGLLVALGSWRRAAFAFLPGMLLPSLIQTGCNYAALGKLLPAYSDFGGPWYEYGGSHWLKLKLPVRPKGIDFADEPGWKYAFHLTFGHHGWFSLTPVWLAAAVGLVATAARARRTAETPESRFTQLSALTVAVSVVVFAFFVHKTNNYGGNTSGPRWLFWLSPLWLLGLLVAADKFGRSRGGRAVLAVLLGFSAFAVFFPAWNPWRNPWVLQYLEYSGTLRY